MKLLFTTLILCLIALMFISTIGGWAARAFAAQTQSSAQDEGRMGRDPDKSQDKCKQPVCWAGDKDGESCYVCEYGAPTQHVVCTSKNSNQDHSYYNALQANRKKDECPAPSDYNREKYPRR
jgi:hypothetical protein